MAPGSFALKAKKSLASFFSSHEPKRTAENERKETHRKENTTPQPKGLGSPHPRSASTSPDVTNGSPSKDSPSRGKTLMDSLRQKSLRKIGSIGNLRPSPRKNTQPNEPDKSDAPLPTSTDVPLTPKTNFSSSLLPSFEESPIGKPIIDLGRQRADSVVPHSSPVAVPQPVKQNDPFITPVDPSVVPPGTIPNSPTPLQKVLDADRTKDSPSPASDSSFDLNTMRRPLPTPMPGTTFSFEDARPEDVVLPERVRRAAERFDVPTHEPDGTPIDADCVEDMVKTLARLERQETIDGMTAWLDRHHPSPVVHAPKAATKGLFGLSTWPVDDSAYDPETYALAILCSDFNTRIFRRADGKRRMKFLPVMLENDPNDFPVVIWARRERDFGAAERIVPKLAAFVKEKGTLLTDCELDLEEALEAAAVPFYLDIDLEWDPTKRMTSRLLESDKIQDRRSTWGRHFELYDGTGYGRASDVSASRPATSNGEGHPAERSLAFANAEKEIHESLSQLCNGTYVAHHCGSAVPEQGSPAAADGSEKQQEEDLYEELGYNCCHCPVHTWCTEEARPTS